MQLRWGGGCQIPTLAGHNYLEKAIEHKSLHNFLDGMTAGVVALITITAFRLFRTAIICINYFPVFLSSAYPRAGNKS
jgi:chromate transporter